MTNAVERIKDELAELVKEGWGILESEVAARDKKQKVKGTSAILRYQNWYTRALPVVRQLMPGRLSEFEEQYRLGKRKEIDASTYTISDYLMGLKVSDRFGDEKFDHHAVFAMRFQHQIAILQSAQTRIDSILADIRGVLKAELFDTELERAKELLTKGYLRAAGTIAGVVLENHLSTVCDNHQIRIRKKNPTIADYNDSLKNEGILDVPTWRWIQRLGDIRNMCCHAKEREPTTEEVQELIDGVAKASKTIF